MIIFLNGEFIEESKAALPLTDRGFSLGDGVFDTMLAVNGKTCDAHEHFTRLIEHAAVLKLFVDMNAEYFKATVEKLLQINPSSRQRIAIRTAISRGSGNRGLEPPENPQLTVLMRAGDAPDPAILPPPRLIIAQTVRRNEHSPLSRIKSSNYGDNLLALIEAKENGADDAIMLNTAGHIACATTSNIFVKIDGALYTPPLSDGAMEGITRRKLLEHAKEKILRAEDLIQAESIYLTNSIMGVRAAESLNGSKLKNISALAA